MRDQVVEVDMNHPGEGPDDIRLEGWIVGFCEAEGSFVLQNGRNPHFNITNADEQALRNVADFFSARGIEGHFYGPYAPRKTQTKPNFVYAVTKLSECRKLWEFFKPRLQTPYKRTQLGKWEPHFDPQRH